MSSKLTFNLRVQFFFILQESASVIHKFTVLSSLLLVLKLHCVFIGAHISRSVSCLIIAILQMIISTVTVPNDKHETKFR